MKLLLIAAFLLCVTQNSAALYLWPFGSAIKWASEELTEAEIDERSLICKIDVVLLACKALGAQATTFCSSYLHISTSTTTVYTSSYRCVIF
jgi:hypothetical protein